MTEDTTAERRALIHERLDALKRELDALDAPYREGVDALLAHNRERADAPNALRPNRRTP